MITNPTQLEVSLHQLSSFQQMLEAMRLHLKEHNPSVFPTVSESYLRRIEELQQEIIVYLREHPADSPLTIRLAGPVIRHGVIRATIVSQLISGLQSAVYQIGAGLGVLEQPDDGASPKGLRTLLSLNLVATAPGSFVLAMDVATRQLELFSEFDVAASAIERLIQHVNELHQAPEAYSGDRKALRGLRKVGALVKKEVETIEIFFRDQERRAEAAFTPVVRQRIELLLGEPKEGEKTVIGNLIEINVEENTCKIHPEDEPPVDCAYDEALEDDLIAALKRKIEMAGQFIPLDWPQGRYRITKIERFRLLEEDEEVDI